MKGNVNSRRGLRPSSGRGGRHAAKSRLSRILALFSAVAISGGLMVTLAAPASATDARGTQANPYTQQDSVAICHADKNDKKPYGPKKISPNVDGIVGTGGNQHSSHTGDPWQAGMKDAHEAWGDIIPSFYYKDKNGHAQFFRGLNWDDLGAQEIWTNNCQVPSASLSLEKTADRASFSAAGQTITYTFGVTNTGSATISDLSIDDFYFSGTGSLGTITCTDATLDPTGSTSCTATYTTTDDDVTTEKSIRNTARAVGMSLGRTVASNNSNAIVTFSGGEDVQPTPGFELWKTSVADWENQTITYTLRMQRTSNVDVTGAAIDPLPSGTTYVSGSASASDGNISESGGTISWSDVKLNSDELATATFKVSVTAEPGVEIDNIAVVPEGFTNVGACRVSGDLNLCKTTDTVPTPEPTPAWWIKKSASPEDMVTDGTITYTLSATNVGDGDVGGAQAVDTLPVGVTVDEDSLPAGLNYDSSTHELTWTFDLDASGEGRIATVSFKVTVTAGDNATLVNRITELSDGGECEPLDRPEFRSVNRAFVKTPGFEANANCETTNRTPAGSSTSTPPPPPNTPTDTTPQVQGESNVEVEPTPTVLGVSQELPLAPAIAVKPAAHVAPAPSANAHTGQGQSPWTYLLFGAGALLLLGAWRVRRNGNA